tara:strand:- start:259 stop:606 length:348 start_codon:yes stop_codon:yes gene_type:complete
MNLKETIQYYKKQREEYATKLSEITDEIAVLCNKTQPDIDDLFATPASFFTVYEHIGDYEFILGGDGRSAPWSEMREGKICEVTINEDVFLSERQLKILKSYIQEKYHFDHLIIK